ncbi:hypothetical protein [Croceicoccus gelatinilyticus]|uniref:hypothetical protein n=1 Tax=Croceicoccus gelatinilyticus TaxID=2835536 RepID=UPI001BCD9E59|nr:hypothetical protein [Croceicoccus gelatinilyticus]MBS7669460.1 hypothetical protein [Croceicoccus gelatinilyticus]
MDELEKLLFEQDKRDAVLAAAVGELSVNFSHLEGHLNWAIARLLGTTEGRGKVVAAAIRNVSTRLDIFAGLVQIIDMPAATKDALLASHKEIQRLNALRNHLLHNRWTSNENKIWLDINRGKVSLKSRKFKPEEISREAKACVSAIASLMDAIKLFQEYSAKNVTD